MNFNVIWLILTVIFIVVIFIVVFVLSSNSTNATITNDDKDDNKDETVKEDDEDKDDNKDETVKEDDEDKDDNKDETVKEDDEDKDDNKDGTVKEDDEDKDDNKDETVKEDDEDKDDNKDETVKEDDEDKDDNEDETVKEDDKGDDKDDKDNMKSGILTFAAYGDTNSSERHPKIAEMIKGWDPDFLVIAGDLDYSNGKGFDKLYKGTYDDFLAKNKIFPVPGNHDVRNPESNLKFYNEYFGFKKGKQMPGGHEYPADSPDQSGWYTFTVGDGKVQFFMLFHSNSSADGEFEKGSDQYKWFEETYKKSLKNTVVKWRILVTHSGIVGCLHHSCDHRNLSDLGELDLEGIDIAINGHSHAWSLMDLRKSKKTPQGMVKCSALVLNAGTGGQGSHDDTCMSDSVVKVVKKSDGDDAYGATKISFNDSFDSVKLEYYTMNSPHGPYFSYSRKKKGLATRK